MTSILLHEYVEQVEKLIDENRLVEAIEHCRHILHSYPRHIDTYRVMGKALLEKQEYTAANDLFLRILGADPNDFISHVGLSIIYKEESQFDQALWHLERAFEIQPYNIAIQGELRQLYSGQTDTRPGIIPLTGGALARLYMQGELYQQAISELRRILADEPGRMDLQVLLAEALWRDDHRIDAEEVCLNVLQELPNCIVVNAILAEIWLQTGRIPEAQKYLHRLQSLTLQTKRSLDKETIAGQAFAIDGAFPLPEQAALDFLQTGTVVPEAPAEPADDWVEEVTFDATNEEDFSDRVVLEPESGMHSYDWLADIEDQENGEKTAASGDVPSETDWFSEGEAKEALNLTTGELDAEWLADLRGEESDAEFQPLDLEDGVAEAVDDEASKETDWFADEDASDSLGVDLGDTAVTPTQEADEESSDWLDALSDSGSQLEIDSTNLIDDSLTDWAESDADSDEPHVVKEPKTPFWLSEMADKELDAVQLDPEDALDWLTEPEELSSTDDETEIAPTAVLDEAEQADDTVPSETGDLGEAEDWLDALTEGDLLAEDDLFAEGDLLADGGLDDAPTGEAADLADELHVDASTDELAALSDAEDWLQAAATDLDAILEAEENEVDEFPNLAIPELEGEDISTVPDWLNDEDHDLSEELEAAVSSENDPQETPQPEEPEIEPTPAADEDAESGALDWLDDLTADATDQDTLPDPPIETEGMPSWLADAGEEAGVEIVDEWDSASADIPDWLQEPVELADLDEDAPIDDKAGVEAPGLTGLLSEMDAPDEEDALSLDQMDSLLSDWVDEDADDSLTDLLGGFEVESEGETRLTVDEPILDESEDVVAETAVTPQEEAPSEVGLTGLLSNLTLEEAEANEADDDFLADFLSDTDADDDFGDLFTEETPEIETETESALGLGDLDLEGVSLTELLSDSVPEEEITDAGEPAADDSDEWLADLTDLTEPDSEPEVEAAEEVGLTGMLATLWPDEDEAETDADAVEADESVETAVSPDDDPLQDLDDQSAEDIGLTELLAGIDYQEDIHESELSLEEFDIEPVEPSLTEVLTEMDVEPEPEPEEERLPVSAEDTTWLDQLEADTGALQDEADDFDLAEETGLDWLTTPDEPEAEAEEVAPQVVEEETEEAVEAEVIAEQDSAPEDWDDAMSWLEELAAQQDEPVEELPSVAETMLDEELDTAAELMATEPMDGGNTDWLDELTSGDLDIIEPVAETDIIPELPETQVMAEEEIADEPEPALELDDLLGEDEGMSWLDELATDMLEESPTDEAETVPETAVAETPPVEVDDQAWLDDLAASDTSLDEAVDDSPADELPDLDIFTDLFEDEDETFEPLDLETAVDDADLSWLEAVADDPAESEAEPEVDELAALFDSDEAISDEVIADETIADDTIVRDDIEDDGVYAPDPEPIVTGVTDALKEDGGIEEAEADLEEALAWLDELDEEDAVELVEEAPPTRVNPPTDEFELTDSPDIEDEPETVVVAPEPDELDLALDRLEQQVRDEGVAVPETAVFPITLSTDELNAALDWIEQTETMPEVEAEVVEPAAVEIDEDVPETAVVEEADLDFDTMADDPEAWLEQMLSDDLEMDIEMEPPPIKPSEDAMFVTDDIAIEEDVRELEVVDPEVIAEDTETGDSLLDDVTLEGLPDDPDAAVAWLDEQADDDTSAELEIAQDTEVEPDGAEAPEEADAISMEDDPEAWLEQMLSGEMEMDIEMEPPPIKPSEDAMFVTGDAEPQAEGDEPAAKLEPAAIDAVEEVIETVAESEEPIEAVTDIDIPETVEAEVIEPVAEESEDAEAELDLGDMEDDPEAWLEQLLSDDLDMDIEMEPPPIKPSEDAMFVTDDAAGDTDVPEEAVEVEETTPEPESETLPYSEADIIADVPDDPDEAMAWLEQLAARQGAAMDELPTVTDAEAEPKMPDWMAEDLEELSAEPDLERVDEADQVETAVTEIAEPVLDEDVDSELPDWLDDDDAPMTGQTDWLRTLPEVDMETWLSAEEEATVAGPTDEIVIPDTGPLTAPPQTGPAVELEEDDLFEPVLEPSTGAYSVDEAKLTVAQTALADGRLDEATTQFKDLVATGSGMMAIISELEQAADAHPQAPALFQVLGDAYMRNGQLQKALASYRAALNQM